MIINYKFVDFFPLPLPVLILEKGLIRVCVVCLLLEPRTTVAGNVSQSSGAQSSLLHMCSACSAEVFLGEAWPLASGVCRVLVWC